ncbi:MAG TPA: GntR family transcriptional regulator [Kiloniellaceae bacterium]|nr:GntR family transcriptional regulator [Kiloniellaceae bacterium]
MPKAAPISHPEGDLSATSAVDKVVRQIREHISDSKLTVGDSLPTERELCALFDASRNTVREAMRILKAYGLVDVRPKIGATITDNRLSRAFDLFSFNTIEITRKTYVDIQGFRTMVEVDTVDRIFDHARQSDINELRDLNNTIRRATSIPDAAAADFAFHLRLVNILGNAAVGDVYRIIKPIVIRIMEMRLPIEQFTTSVFDEHAEVVNALEARNRIKYQYALQTHLDQGLINFEQDTEGAI